MPDYHTLCLDRIVRFISTSVIPSARRIVGTTQSGEMLRIRALRATVLAANAVRLQTNGSGT